MAVLDNKSCQVCFASEATGFCDCQDPPTLFCSDCSVLHSRKDLLIHQTIPISALGRNLKDYKRKHDALMKAAVELRKSVERMDQCSREIEEMIKTCANYLTECGSWWVQYVHTEKQELSVAIEAAVLEATTCLDQNLEPQSPLAWALWTLLPEEMQVVSYSVTTPDLQVSLQTCISYQNNLQALCGRSKLVEKANSDSTSSISSGLPAIPLYGNRVLPPAHTEESKSVPTICIPSKDICALQSEEIKRATILDESASELAQVTNLSLRFFNFQALNWGPRIHLSTQIDADGRSRWVVMKDGRVFCCGGKKAFILVRDGSVEQMANMNKTRFGPGVLSINYAIYIFGGRKADSTSLHTCEKSELTNNKWTFLPSMREARCNFNACIFLGTVYLCGSSYIMEAFALQTDTFLPFHTRLAEDNSCCAYVDDHLLVVHSTHYILKFAVGPDGRLTERSEMKSPAISKWQNSQPVVDKVNGIFYTIQNRRCLSFSMETGIQGPTVESE